MKPELARHSASFRYFLLPLLRVLVGGLMILLGPWRVRGRRRVPSSGGVLIVANHLSDLDPVFVQLACPRPIHFMGKRELFDMPSIAWVLRLWRAFPVNRGEPDRSALRHAVDLLRMGEVVCVFPEGQLSEDGRLREFKPGVSLIARAGAATVIPVAISGTQFVVPYGSMTPRPAFRWVSAQWGDPLAVTKEMDPEELMRWLRREIESLLAEKW